jgi:hypothetical protein
MLGKTGLAGVFALILLGTASCGDKSAVSELEGGTGGGAIDSGSGGTIHTGGSGGSGGTGGSFDSGLDAGDAAWDGGDEWSMSCMEDNDAGLSGPEGKCEKCICEKCPDPYEMMATHGQEARDMLACADQNNVSGECLVCGEACTTSNILQGPCADEILAACPGCVCTSAADTANCASLLQCNEPLMAGIMPCAAVFDFMECRRKKCKKECDPPDPCEGVDAGSPPPPMCGDLPTGAEVVVKADWVGAMMGMPSGGTIARYEFNSGKIYYWDNNNGFKRADKNGANPRDLQIDDVNMETFTIDDSHFFWVASDPFSNDTLLKKAPLKGGNPTSILALTGSMLSGMTTDKNNVYWIHNEVTTTKMAKAPKSPGKLTFIKDWVQNYGTARLILDGGRFFFLDPGTTMISASAGRVLSLAASGSGGLVELAEGIVTPTAIAVDGSHVYWTDSGTLDTSTSYNFDGAVMRVPRKGGKVQKVAKGFEVPTFIAVDGTYVYWMRGLGRYTNEDGVLWKKKKDLSGKLIVVGENLLNPRDLAVDKTHLYWIQRCEFGFETELDVIVRMPK